MTLSQRRCAIPAPFRATKSGGAAPLMPGLGRSFPLLGVGVSLMSRSRPGAMNNCGCLLGRIARPSPRRQASRPAGAFFARGALPSTFMSLAPGSNSHDVWHDVTRMLTLNGSQAKRSVEKHICPLQFDIVDRLIERYSNPDELVYDPFCGIGTVPYRAILKGRRGGGSELNPGYFMDQVHYLKAAEREFSMPDLFDAIEEEVAA